MACRWTRLGLTRGSGIFARSISMHYDQSFILTFTAKLACRFVKRVVYPICSIATYSLKRSLSDGDE